MKNNKSYYIFSPPYSDSEYFVSVIDIKVNEKDQNKYVYYDHLLSDLDGSCEVNAFQQSARELTEESVSNIIKNIKEQIKDLKEKRSDFLEVLNKIQEEKNGDIVNSENLETNSSNEDIKERDIERVN